MLPDADADVNKNKDEKGHNTNIYSNQNNEFFKKMISTILLYDTRPISSTGKIFDTFEIYLSAIFLLFEHVDDLVKLLKFWITRWNAANDVSTI